jgi:hypothetical protein
VTADRYTPRREDRFSSGLWTVGVRGPSLDAAGRRGHGLRAAGQLALKYLYGAR